MSRSNADALLDALPVGLLVFDARGLVVRLNALGHALVGRDPPVVGRPVEGVLAPLDILVAASGGRTLPIDVVGDDGVTRRLAVTVTAGPDRCWMVTLAPAAEQSALRGHGVTPVGASVPLGSLEDVLPSLLHELRNPLAAMTSTVELLVEEMPPGALRSELEAVLVEGRRMDLSFQGIGMAGRSLRSGRLQQIEPAVHEVVRTMRSAAARAGVFLRLDVAAMPAMYVNAAVVRAMLYNVIHNAITACRAGDEVRVRAAVNDAGLLELLVRDTGVGMSEEVLARCTDPFYSTRTHGSGLGLSLCRRAVEAVGGRCIVLSSLGRGTQVVLEVPMAPADRPEPGR